jgi:hypothetical protein
VSPHLWNLRRRVRIALRRVDGTEESEQRVIAAYDALVEAEPRGEWAS